MRHCFLLFQKSRDFWGPRWASQSQKSQKSLRFRCAKPLNFSGLWGSKFHIARFTLSYPGETRAFSFLALSHPCTPPASPVPRPFLARSSPGLTRSSSGLAQPSPGPGFKQSDRKNGQKRNLLLWGFTAPEPEEHLQIQRTEGKKASLDRSSDLLHLEPSNMKFKKLLNLTIKFSRLSSKILVKFQASQRKTSKLEANFAIECRMCLN